MNGSPELLEFYLVEATEYVDALDQLVAGGDATPDANAFIATSRALRGSSTMAKADEIAELSLVLEQLAHGLRDGELDWTLELFRSIRDTVADLRFLVRGVRMWGAREDARADARLTDLKRFLPGERGRAEAPTPDATAPVFVALQASAIAAELDAFVQNPGRRRALDDALSRSRTLRGIAGIGDFAPLSDVADAVERVGRSLMPDAPLANDQVELFRAAAGVLRRASDELRSGRRISTNSDEVARFTRAVEGGRSGRETPAQVVPIATLYYEDGGPQLVERGPNPPTTPEGRFRQDATVRAEHIVRLVHDARESTEGAGHDRAARALLDALRDMERFSASFGVHQVAAFFGEAARERELLDSTLLGAIERGASIVASLGSAPGTVPFDEVERRLAMLERSRRTPATVPAVAAPAPAVSAPPAAAAPTAPPPAAAPPAASIPAAPAAEGTAAGNGRERESSPPRATPPHMVAPGATPPRRAAPTPTGRELQELLSDGIAALAPLDREPLAAPAPIEDDEIVPIETILYQGAAALERAILLRDRLRARGFTGDETLQELFDLLDLARSE